MARQQHPSSVLPSNGHRPHGESDPSVRLRSVAKSTDPQALSTALGDSSPDVARAAIRRLVELEGTKAAPALRAVLLDADVALTADLAKALRELNDSEATKLARFGLGDERYTHRLAGAITLGIVGDAEVRPDLAAALSDPIAAVRAAALEALMRVGPNPEAVEAAATLLTDASPQVRVAAVRLVASKHPQPTPLLATAASDEDPEVRCELARHLGKLDRDIAGKLLADRDEGVRCQAVRCAGPEHTGALARLLVSDRRAEVRRAAAHTLGRIGGPAAGEALMPGIEDRDGIVRARVMRALERALGRTGAITRLAGELQSARTSRRRSALYALAQFNDRDRTTLVWRLADDPDLDVRLAVVATAGALLSEPDPLLMYMRTDPNTEVQRSAERRLAARSS